MRLLRVLFFPVVLVGRIVIGLIRFILITQVMITAVSLLVLAAGAYLFFKGDTDALRRFANMILVHRGD